MLSDAQIDSLTTYLQKRFGVDVLWLFGSEASGRATPDSDVDVAGLFATRPSTLDLLDAQQALSALLGREVDLVDLDRASPILAMQVYRHGRVLVDTEPKRRIRAISAAASRYEDVRITRREAERALFARIRNGRS